MEIDDRVDIKLNEKDLKDAIAYWLNSKGYEPTFIGLYNQQIEIKVLANKIKK